MKNKLLEVLGKFNITNLSNRYYADSLYTGHYVPGAPRAVSGTLSVRF